MSVVVADTKSVFTLLSEAELSFVELFLATLFWLVVPGATLFILSYLGLRIARHSS